MTDPAMHNGSREDAHNLDDLKLRKQLRDEAFAGRPTTMAERRAFRLMREDRLDFKAAIAQAEAELGL